MFALEIVRTSTVMNFIFFISILIQKQMRRFLITINFPAIMLNEN
jgi:hypothetical protein